MLIFNTGSTLVALQASFPPPIRSEFKILDVDGTYVQFEATPVTSPAHEGGDGMEMSVELTNIEVIERGSIFDRQGAD